MFDRRSQRGGLTEVALEDEHLHARVGFCELARDVDAGIGGAVVDEDDLEGSSRRLDGREDLVVELLEIVRFIEDGHEDRDIDGRGVHDCLSSSFALRARTTPAMQAPAAMAAAAATATTTRGGASPRIRRAR